jgi:hypothetical protein
MSAGHAPHTLPGTAVSTAAVHAIRPASVIEARTRTVFLISSPSITESLDKPAEPHEATTLASVDESSKRREPSYLSS